jgi:hypothetical protein
MDLLLNAIKDKTYVSEGGPRIVTNCWRGEGAAEGTRATGCKARGTKRIESLGKSLQQFRVMQTQIKKGFIGHYN